MAEAFNRYGFAILQCAERSDSRSDLLGLKEIFGATAPHPRADNDGIVGINQERATEGFLGSTNLQHLLHTDGAFSDNPEKIITLQCVTPSRIGGVSILSSAQAAYEHMARNYPDRVGDLLRHNALTVKRKDQSSTQPIFLKSEGRYGIKFRMADGASEVRPHPDVRDLFDELSAFFAAPENRLEFSLSAGQVFIADNTAVVHGRTSFPDGQKREMRRLNFMQSPQRHFMLGFNPNSDVSSNIHFAG